MAVLNKRFGIYTSLVGGILLASAIWSLTLAQIADVKGKQSNKGSLILPVEPPKKSESLPLEGPIDPAKYILGPGDDLEFKVWGKIELKFDLTVRPDGSVSIPTVGNVKVAGLSLSDADSTVNLIAKRNYRNSNVSLRLIRVRFMKASISGAVETPGVYELSAIDRLSFLIEQAGGFFEPDLEIPELEMDRRKKSVHSSIDAKAELELEKQIAPSKRRITITNRNGQVRNIDYQHYEKTGNIKFNPIISAGDQVHVPVIFEDVGILHVYGAVKEEGEYEFVEGDHLLDLVELTGGFTANALTTDIRIRRFNPDGTEHREISVDFTQLIPGGRGPQLKADDRVYIREISDFHKRLHVTITGEVVYPGVYPIVKDGTNLTDIIATSGGFTNRADLNMAKVERLSAADIEDPEYERLKVMSVAEMSNMEYEYFKTRSREEAPKVVVDFKKLFLEGNNSHDINLQDRDEIFIATLSPTVNVTGQINRPGLIRWVEGNDVKYYIDKAGGYSWNARTAKLRLIKANTGTWIKPRKKTVVEIGDTIFVPEKQEIHYWELWKDILLVFSQIATILLVVRSV